MSDPLVEEGVYSTPDGAEIAYRMRPGRKPVVLVHGLGCDATMWDGVIEAMPPDVGVIVPELRGHGGSTLGWRAPSVDQWADDVVGLLKHKKIDRPAVAGLSMGGYTALAIAAGHEGFARAFALINTTAMPDDDAARAKRAAGAAMIRRAGSRAFAEGLVPVLLNENRPHFVASREHLLAMFARAGDSGLPPTLMALAGRPDRTDMLASIKVPTIVISGTADKLIPPDRSKSLAAAIRGARLYVLDDVAHMSPMEAPQLVAGFLDPMWARA